eukprot:CAMPEP_0115531322 /NCGR_PEP_ID=MMETSP0271-20121206/84977_1 /TAXON_ID=71861 /ORGANISM="Scrippsiella trochoidea, Strain CCMP3099" /LENGTH=79 /DNA_ID=CAMNT_0002963531 /DNA_START=399 /DNA_END=636 /DNA_ORIENTATION=+
MTRLWAKDPGGAIRGAGRNAGGERSALTLRSKHRWQSSASKENLAKSVSDLLDPRFDDVSETRPKHLLELLQEIEPSGK